MPNTRPIAGLKHGPAVALLSMLMLGISAPSLSLSATANDHGGNKSVSESPKRDGSQEQEARILAEEIWMASDRGRAEEVELSIGEPSSYTTISLQSSSTFSPAEEDSLVEEPLTVYRGATDSMIATVAVSPSGIVLSIDGPGDHNHRLVVPVEEIETEEDPGKGSIDPNNDLSQGVPTEPDFHGMLKARSLDGSELREATGSNEEVVPDQVKGTYASPPGGNSIYLSKHLWKRGSWCWPSCGAREPINVIFYNYAYANRMDRIHTDIRGGRRSCGSSSQAYFGDGRHGGSNQWQTQDAHYAWADQAANVCPVTGPRVHLRSYTSRSGDNHWPGFRYYTVGGIHHENWAHGNVDPQRGQDYMFFRWPQHPWVSNGGTTIIPNSSSECASCHNWGGFVDFYNVTTGSSDSCSGSKNYRFNSSGQAVTWTCS